MDEKQEEVKALNLWQKMSKIQGMAFDIAKDKAAHGYSYATLDQIMDKLSPVLYAEKLLLYHETNYDTEEKCSYIKTTVLDVEKPEDKLTSLTYLNSNVKLPGQNEVMVIGSMITYYRRYHVTSMFGLTTESDTDAGGAVKDGAAKKAGRSVEAAGVEKKVEFVPIFKNMIDKGKTKDLISKTFESYKPKMSAEEIEAVNKLITEIK